jgi:Holliday junction DNA helicase RuvB
MNTNATSRPKRFDDYVGQEMSIALLRSLVANALKSQEAMSNTLILGPTGTGKTTLAEMIAAEMGSPFVDKMATDLNKWPEVVKLLLSLAPNQIVFIDEIHMLTREIQTRLFRVLEDGFLSFYDARLGTDVKKALPRFTVIGATTDEGKLLAPFLGRFATKVRLKAYSVKQLNDMAVSRAMSAHGVTLKPQAALALANMSLSTARTLASNLENTVKIANGSMKGSVTSQPLGVDAVLTMAFLNGLDPIIGLDYSSRRYLVGLVGQGGKPVGSRMLAILANEEEENVTRRIEPALARPFTFDVSEGEGDEKVTETITGALIEQTPRGRIATAATHAYLKMLRQWQAVGWFDGEDLGPND